MKKWIVYYYGTSGNGVVDNDNEPRGDGDPSFAMQFDSEEEAQKWIDENQKDWASTLRASLYDFDSDGSW